MIALKEPIEAWALDDTGAHAVTAMVDFSAGHMIEVQRQGPPPLTGSVWEANGVAYYRECGLAVDYVTVFRAAPPNREAEDQTPGLYATLNLGPAS